MTRTPVRQVATAKPVAAPPSRRAGAKATSRAAAKPMAAAGAVPPAKRLAPNPLVAKLPAAAVAGEAARTVSPKAAVPQTGMALHTATGARKYLTAGERDAFLRQADVANREVRTLCMTLAYAGCRLSEALALTTDRVDLAAGADDRESEKASHGNLSRGTRPPCPAGDARHGARHSRGAVPPRKP